MPPKEHGGTPRPDEGRSIATIEYKQAIESKINSQYPLVLDRDEAFTAYMNGDTYFCSINDNTKSEIQRKILLESLRRAENPESIEFSQHGAGHQTYLEVLQTMTSFLQDGQATRHSGHKLIPIDKKQTLRTVESFVLIGPTYERQTYMPKALSDAKEIQTDLPTLIKIARNFALDPQKGYVYALLFLTYKGISTENITKALSNKHWLQNNEKNIAGRVLKEGHGDAITTLVNLHNMIQIPDLGGNLHPTNDPATHRKVLEFLRGKGFAANRDNQSLGFVEVTANSYPLVVFTGVTELAEKIASPNFVDPVRHKYIFDKFGGRMTTRIKTAYLVSG